MANRWLDANGIYGSRLRVGGFTGPSVGNSSGDVAARNAADAAYVPVRGLLFKSFGDDFELNSGATGAGADWKMTFSRPSTGMTHALQVIFPSGDPSPGQALTVLSFVGDVITLQWSTVAGGADKTVVDTTTLAFGASSPLAMFTNPGTDVILLIEVIVDTAFNGTPSLSIGITGTTSKYMPSTAIDLTMAATTIFEWKPGLPAAGSPENLIATYSAGGASAGSARILVHHVLPS